MLSTYTLLEQVKRTQPTNRVRLVNHFNCSYDLLDTTLSLIYKEVITRGSVNGGIEVVTVDYID